MRGAYKLLILLLLFPLILSEDIACPSCNNTSVGRDFVESYCQHVDGLMSGRCCYKQENSTKLIGLDLSNCGLTDLNITRFSDAIIIDLLNNDVNKATKEEFIGLINLEYLYLPMHLSCPGGDQAWNESIKNTTYNCTECYLQLNPCDYLNVSCTSNGMCFHTGPGSAKCECKPTYHGYKCLEQGEFPGLMYGLSITIPMILLSSCLWYTVRRHVANPTKRD